MSLKKLNILVAVLVISTAIYTIFVFIPNTREDIVNTEIYAVADSTSFVEQENPLGKSLPFVDGNTYLYTFSVLNREIPRRWQGKEISLKYTYLGEYSDSTVSELNELLLGDYKWQRQLDQDRNIVLGGPIFVMDNTYQLHTHNGLSLANKHYLFGDLLHLLYSEAKLDGTQIQIGDTVLQAIWYKDVRVLEDNRTPSSADLIISTCLERNGDRRLISGWIVISPVELQ